MDTYRPTASSAPMGVADSGQQLIPLAEVMRRLNISRGTVYNLMKTGDLLPPVKIGRSSRWVESEIDAFIGKAAAARPSVRPTIPAAA